MNKLIKEQLLKVTATKIEFNDDTTELFIPKTLVISNASLKKGMVYRIKLEPFITNPNPSSTLASNWNNGIIPKYDEYYADIIDRMGVMIKVNAVAVEDNTSQFVGWLPDNGFTVISKE